MVCKELFLLVKFSVKSTQKSPSPVSLPPLCFSCGEGTSGARRGLVRSGWANVEPVVEVQVFLQSTRLLHAHYLVCLVGHSCFSEEEADSSKRLTSGGESSHLPTLLSCYFYTTAILIGHVLYSLKAFVGP